MYDRTLESVQNLQLNFSTLPTIYFCYFLFLLHFGNNPEISYDVYFYRFFNQKIVGTCSKCANNFDVSASYKRCVDHYTVAKYGHLLSPWMHCHALFHLVGCVSAYKSFVLFRFVSILSFNWNWLYILFFISILILLIF